MPVSRDINKQSRLIISLNDSPDKALLPVEFNNEKISLLHVSAVYADPFIKDALIPNGALLGTGGLKKVFHINGKAVFLIPCGSIERLEQIIDQEVSTSLEMIARGLYAQELSKGTIGIYDPESHSYLDYPCMFADSFSTLSKEKGIEVFDTKNAYRFGSKYKVYDSDEGCRNNFLNRQIFRPILDDLALLLYLNFGIDERDSFNLAFMPSETEGTATTVRLFMYDFSSKYEAPVKGFAPIAKPPKDEKIKRLLNNIIRNVLDADHIARTGRRSAFPPLFINDFIYTIYPEIENEFIDYVVSKIIGHIAAPGVDSQDTKTSQLDSQAPKILDYVESKIIDHIAAPGVDSQDTKTPELDSQAPKIDDDDILETQKIKFKNLLVALKIKTDELIRKGTKDNVAFDPRYIDAGDHALILNRDLDKAGSQFFERPTSANFLIFKQTCNAAIKMASIEFKKNRSSFSIELWNEINPIIKGILGILAALTILPAIVVAMTSKHGYANTFFANRQTESFEYLQAFENGKEEIIKKISPQYSSTA